MITYSAAATEHDRQMRLLALKALRVTRNAWRNISLVDLDRSWTETAPELTRSVQALMTAAATEGAAFGAMALAEQGAYVFPQGFVNPRAFALSAPDGRPLESLLYSPVTKTKSLIGAGMVPQQALAMGGRDLDRITRTVLSDTGRGAASVDRASRAGVGYIRMLNPPSCSRCAVLAGRFYRWNAGFLRHPRCDCRGIPAQESHADDLRVDPYEYFNSLSPEEQDKHFTTAGAQAIRDGSDLFQVVNSRRGMSYAGISQDGTRRGQSLLSLNTDEGTTKRGDFGSSERLRADSEGFEPVARSKYQRTVQKRLTPEGIYAQNLPREQTLEQLRRFGYIQPGGQNPNGVIANPSRPVSTMSEAQKRVQRATLAWDAVQEGRNPFGKGPLTPQIRAQAETNYRRWIGSAGEIFTR
ncbi:hypothetical protein [Glutamicibacter sp. Je.9.36]|uniref:VG15 protein n=1 Tax=Glutamicibacter sp. Je.9.36 TaxID=3142837 RepID=UPI003DA860DD